MYIKQNVRNAIQCKPFICVSTNVFPAVSDTAKSIHLEFYIKRRACMRSAIYELVCSAQQNDVDAFLFSIHNMYTRRYIIIGWPAAFDVIAMRARFRALNLKSWVLMRYTTTTYIHTYIICIRRTRIVGYHDRLSDFLQYFEWQFLYMSHTNWLVPYIY